MGRLEEMKMLAMRQSRGEGVGLGRDWRKSLL